MITCLRSFQVIEQPGLYASTQSSSRKTKDTDFSGSERKPLHPPQVKNRGQGKIQDFVDQEKALVKSVIDHLNAGGTFESALHSHVRACLDSKQQLC